VALRETKKAATRAAIADAALGLFLARGFDRVTVAEVADAAGVSVNTAFNYFPTKEDLFFDRQDAVIDRLAAAVRERRPGEGAVAALRRLLVAELDAGEPTLGLDPGAPAFWRVVEASPALQARLLRLQERAQAALAEALGGGPLARLAAALLAGIDSAVHGEIRRRILAGDDPARVRADTRAFVEQATTLAERGLGDYPG
jgi:AcrR family transcriptional regulator